MEDQPSYDEIPEIYTAKEIGRRQFLAQIEAEILDVAYSLANEEGDIAPIGDAVKALLAIASKLIDERL